MRFTVKLFREQLLWKIKLTRRGVVVDVGASVSFDWEVILLRKKIDLFLFFFLLLVLEHFFFFDKEWWTWRYVCVF